MTHTDGRNTQGGGGARTPRRIALRRWGANLGPEKVVAQDTDMGQRLDHNVDVVGSAEVVQTDKARQKRLAVDRPHLGVGYMFQGRAGAGVDSTKHWQRLQIIPHQPNMSMSSKRNGQRHNSAVFERVPASSEATASGENTGLMNWRMSLRELSTTSYPSGRQ